MAAYIDEILWISTPATSLLILLGLFITLLSKLYCRIDGANKKIDKISQIVTIAAFMFNIIYSICVLAINIIQICLYDQNIYTSQWGFFMDFLDIAIGISLSGTFTSIYIFLLLRIRNTFKETIFEIKSRIIYLHIINITFIYISFCIIYFVLNDSRNAVRTGMILHSFLFLLLTIGYIHLLYTFNHNLFLLVLSQRQERANPQKNIELNDIQHELLTTIRKHSILAGFMISISFVFLIMIFVTSSHNGYKSENNLIFVESLWVLTLFIFMNTGPLCIYLGFGMNQDLYTKLCGLCDKKCKNICISMVEKRLNKQCQTAPDIELETIDM